MKPKGIYWWQVTKKWFKYSHENNFCLYTDYTDVGYTTLRKGFSRWSVDLFGVVQHLNSLFTVMIVAVSRRCGGQCGDVPVNERKTHVFDCVDISVDQCWRETLTTATAVKHCQWSETQEPTETPPPEITEPQCWAEKIHKTREYKHTNNSK